MRREEVQEKIKGIGVMTAGRERSRDAALFAAEAAFHGAIAVIEIALTMPEATTVISHLATNIPRIVVRAGNVSSLNKMSHMTAA